MLSSITEIAVPSLPVVTTLQYSQSSHGENNNQAGFIQLICVNSGKYPSQWQGILVTVWWALHPFANIPLLIAAMHVPRSSFLSLHPNLSDHSVAPPPAIEDSVTRQMVSA